MVRPARFGYNEETAGDNAFQSSGGKHSPAEIQSKAIDEFDAFVQKLQKQDIDVIVAQDSDIPEKPDAVFPNNWISFHENGVLITYPMFSPKRRLERQSSIIAQIRERFKVERRIHLEDYEKEGYYLEGTGSLILDRQNQYVYAGISSRTNRDLLGRFCELTGYEPIVFHPKDDNGLEIYHTNVMMTLGETFVVICLETIREEAEKQLLQTVFSRTNKEIVEIYMEQMQAFAGNMLQVKNRAGASFIVLSEQAFQSLTPGQIRQLERHSQLLYSPIPTIETYGGGSARCMIAEVFLPEK